MAIWFINVDHHVVYVKQAARMPYIHHQIIQTHDFYLGLFDGILTSTQNSNHHQIMRF